MKITLDMLPTGKSAKIIKLNTNYILKRRLLDLGFISNTDIKSLYKSPFNDPTCYLIKDSVIALRKNDSKKILIDYKDDSYGTN